MAFYFFPGTMYQRAKKANKKTQSNYSYITRQSNDLFELYSLATNQYLGLGTVLQFIPTTNAFKARVQFSDELKNTINQIKQKLKELPAIEKHAYEYKELKIFENLALRSSLYSIINFSPLFTMFEDIANGFNRHDVVFNEKLSWRELGITLPVLNNIFKFNENVVHRKHPVKNVLHSIINPFRLIESLINFMHKTGNRFLELGADDYRASVPRIFLKSILSLAFGVINIPVKLLKHTLDLVLNAVKFIVVDPVTHSAKSIISAFKNRKKSILFGTAEEFRQMRELRRDAKEPDDNFGIKRFEKNHKRNHTAAGEQTISKTEYMGVSKMNLYPDLALDENDTCKPNRLVAIRASAGKIEASSELLFVADIYNYKFFPTDDERAEHNKTAIRHAKDILEDYLEDSANKPKK